MTLPILAAERRRPLDRHILPAKRSAANPLAVVAIVDRWVRQTDRRTDARAFHVDGSCAEHLTVESYTIFICQQSYLLLSGIPSPIHSFIPGLKPSFSANPFHRSPSFFFFRIHYMDSPDCLLLFLSICFILFVFLFLHFLAVGSVR